MLVGVQSLMVYPPVRAFSPYDYKKLCGSPPGVMMADTLSFNAKIGVVDF